MDKPEQELPQARLLQVELFEDRAAMTRTIELPVGQHTVFLRNVSPLVQSQRLTTPREDADALWTLENAEVLFEHKGNDRDESDKVRTLRSSFDEQQRICRKAELAKERKQSAYQRAEQAVSAAVSATAASLQAGEEPTAWIDAIRELTAQATRCATALARAEHEARAAANEAERLGATLRKLTMAEQDEVATLKVVVNVTRPGTLRFRTIIPCVMWRPAHRAVLDGDTIHWQVRAACWNASGIDLTDTNIVCSTARPGQLAEPPSLRDDVVTTQRRSKEIVVEAREESVDHARPQDPRLQDTLPGVDDGGEARTFVCPTPMTLPNDGEPTFVDLETFSTPCKRSYKAIPHKDGQVFLTTVADNLCSRPLLAGPVELIRDGILLGRGRIKLIASKERFELGWGSHDDLRVVRRVEHDVDRTLITGSQKHTIQVELRVTHQGTEPVIVELQERIPVSELKQVSVELLHSEPPLTQTPDQDGLCHWKVELNPDKRRTFSMRYTVSAPSNVRLPHL